MVTPISLNGAGCALAVLAVSAKENNNTTSMFVFTDASLLCALLPNLYSGCSTDSPAPEMACNLTRLLVAPLDRLAQPAFGEGGNLEIVLFQHQHVPIALDPDIGEANETHR